MARTRMSTSTVAVNPEPSVWRSVRVTFSDARRFLRNYWERNGESGVMVSSSEALRDGEILWLEVKIAAPQAVFRLGGIVRWSSPSRSGNVDLGIAFLPSGRQVQSQLMRWVNGQDPVFPNRRTRAPIEVGARCVATGKTRFCRARNLSSGGAFISSPLPPEAGTLVTISFDRLDRGASVDLDAVVVWRRIAGRDPGFGVRFLTHSDFTAAALERAVVSGS